MYVIHRKYIAFRKKQGRRSPCFQGLQKECGLLSVMTSVYLTCYRDVSVGPLEPVPAAREQARAALGFLRRSHSRAHRACSSAMEGPTSAARQVIVRGLSCIGHALVSTRVSKGHPLVADVYTSMACLSRCAHEKPVVCLSCITQDRRRQGHIPTLLRCRGYVSGLNPTSGAPFAPRTERINT